MPPAAVALAALSLCLLARAQAPPPPPDSVHIPLLHSQDQKYVAMVNMSYGANTQRFGFALSTTTGFTIVANASCTACAGKNVSTYNPAQSISAAPVGAGQQQQTVSIAGAALDAGAGTLSKEDCALHQANGSFWQYPNQTIVQAAASPVFQPGVSGLIGLGTNAPFDATPLGQWLGRNPAQPNVSFGLALAPLPAVTTQQTVPADPAGTLHMLQPDPGAYTGPIAWHAAAPNASGWAIQMDGWAFAAGSAQASNAAGGPAAVEPFFAGIFLPAAQAAQLYAALPGAAQLPRAPGALTQAYAVPCAAAPTFSALLGGRAYAVPPAALVLRAPDGTCVGAVEGWDAPGFLLGSRFLSTVYVVFQTGRPPAAQQQIGIADRAAAAAPGRARNVGAIAGGTVGGAVAVLLLAGALFWLVRRRTRAPVPMPVVKRAPLPEKAGLGAAWAPEPYSPPAADYPAPLSPGNSAPLSPSTPATATSATGFLAHQQAPPRVSQWVRPP